MDSAEPRFQAKPVRTRARPDWVGRRRTSEADPFEQRCRSVVSPVAAIRWIVLLAVILTGGYAAAAAGVQDPYEILSALGLDRDLKQGYTLRADTWGGDLPVDGAKRIGYTLLRGIDYHFYAYAVTKGAKISFHIQDRDGGIVEAHGWQKQKEGACFAGADIIPTTTGSYYLVVKVEQSTADRTEWSLVYAYK